MSQTAPVLTEADCQALEPNARGEVEHDGVVRLCLAVPPSAPIGEMPHTIAFPDRLVPRSEWDDRIAEKDREKSWLYDLVAGVIPCKDQASLGYCHAYGYTAAGECCRAIQGHPYVDLSAESIGGPVTNWRNRGADPSDDLAQFATVGACPAAFMDAPHSLSPSRWKPGWETEAAKYIATEIWDMRAGPGYKGMAFDFAVTMALLGLAGGVGFSWWTHFVSGPYKVRKSGRNYEILPRNNWGPRYGENGFFWLSEGRGTPDWSGCIRQMTGVDA